MLFMERSGYSLYFRGEQKRQEQTKKKGKRFSIIGLWQPLIQFVYSLVLGSFKSKDFICLMDDQADAAQKREECGSLCWILAQST